MKVKYAAGIAIVYNNSILLVHPTKASWQKPLFSIPKGGIDLYETELTAAIRETREEIGIYIPKSKILENVEQYEALAYSDNKVNKVLTYYIYRIKNLTEIGLTDIRVPNSKLQLTEIDYAKFFSKEEAYKIILPYQRIILDKI